MGSVGNEAKAAQIGIAKIRPISASHAKNPKTIEVDSETIFGFNRTKQLMIKVGPNPINDRLHCVKGALG